MSQNLPKRSLQDFLSVRHLNHLVLAGANNRNVIITYLVLAAPVQANRDFSWHTDLTRELLVGECLLGISLSGRNACGGNNFILKNFREIPTILNPFHVFPCRKPSGMLVQINAKETSWNFWEAGLSMGASQKPVAA